VLNKAKKTNNTNKNINKHKLLRKNAFFKVDLKMDKFWADLM